LNQPIDIPPFASTRNFIYPYGCSKANVNRALSKSGIWLLYGHLSAMEESGLMDRGVQYAVINESALRISRETSYVEIIKS